MGTKTAEVKRANKLLSALPLLLLLCLVSACVRPLNSFYSDTDAGGWKENVWVFVDYENTDTTAINDIDIAVRFNSLFEYDKFRFVLEAAAPDGTFRYDTLQVDYIPDVSIAYTETIKPYLQNAGFDRTGTYRFGFRPLMPVNEIRGVGGVGIIIR